MEEKTNFSGSTSIKIILDDIQGIIGLKSIIFFLDEKPLKPIPLGGFEVITVSPGKHKIQTVLKASSLITFFITITRKSAVLTINAAPDSQMSVIAKYNRISGNLDIKQVVD